MLTKLTSILLLILLNIPLFSKWSFVVYYQVNKSYIAKELCVNKNRPELHCDGKCFLAKKLKAAEEKEQKEATEQLEKMPEIVLFCHNIVFDWQGIWLGEKPVIQCFSYLEPYFVGSLSRIFHPPRC